MTYPWAAAVEEHGSMLQDSCCFVQTITEWALHFKCNCSWGLTDLQNLQAQLLSPETCRKSCSTCQASAAIDSTGAAACINCYCLHHLLPASTAVCIICCLHHLLPASTAVQGCRCWLMIWGAGVV